MKENVMKKFMALPVEAEVNGGSISTAFMREASNEILADLQASGEVGEEFDLYRVTFKKIDRVRIQPSAVSVKGEKNGK